MAITTPIHKPCGWEKPRLLAYDEIRNSESHEAPKLNEIGGTNFLGRFVLLLLVLAFAARAVGKDNNASTADLGSFVTLKRGDGSEFRAFFAGPADAKAAVLIVHDYLGISDATKQSVQHLGALGVGRQIPLSASSASILFTNKLVSTKSKLHRDVVLSSEADCVLQITANSRH